LHCSVTKASSFGYMTTDAIDDAISATTVQSTATMNDWRVEVP
tara:strand:- start:69 stop:197 length:129 start_codon:yes stop_codon:yes gene_type:complete